MADGVDNLEVGAGLAGQEAEAGAEPHLMQLRLDGAAALAAQQPKRFAGTAQLGNHLAHVDALATGICAHFSDAVDGIQRKVGDFDGLIQRRIQGHGINHRVALLITGFKTIIKTVETKAYLYHISECNRCQAFISTNYSAAFCVISTIQNVRGPNRPADGGASCF